MVLNVRDTIVSGTFSASLSLLQNYPPTDFNILMTLATKLQQSTDPDILTNAIPTNATTPLVLDANDAMSLVVNDLDSIKTSIEQAARRRNRKRPTTTTTPASPLEPSQPHPLAPDTTSASSESTTTTTATSTVTTTPAIVIPTVLSPEPGGLSPAQTASFLKSLLE
ncbi:hypothetical protein Pelo_16400 [Pelomyxa schiedti]|nr:hypothetical protein Pelo_16400 [Pelomyxa schiedti]